MVKKTSPVSKTVKKPAGKNQSTKSKLPKANLITKEKTTQADLKRQLKIQKVLYEIADAASAVRNMQSFYKKLHRIVGKLMYAENFFIALYDVQSDLISFPYRVDTADVETPPPQHLAEQHGATAWVIQHGEALDRSSGRFDAAIARGEMEQVGTKSNGIVVPLKSEDKMIGALAVQSYTDGIIYNAQDVELLTFVAQHISTALTRARAIEETRQRVAELQIINSIQQGLAAELNFQSIVDLVGDKLSEVFNTPNLNITWYDEKANLIHYLYIYEYGQRKVVDPQPPRPGGIFETLVATRQPIILNTVEEQRKLNAVTPLPGTAASKSSIEVPIISSDKVLGDIGIENFERENAFGESDLRLLTTIAASLGTALENARLFDETQRLLKETEQRNAELAIINSVQDALAAKLDLQGIYDAVGDKMREIFKADTTLICFHDVENNLIVAPYYKDREMSGLIRRPYGRGLAEIVIETGKPLLLNTRQAAEKAGFFEIASPGSDKDLNESTLFVPIFRDGKAIGSTSVQSYKQSAYDQSDLRLLTTIANSMSVALENARLFDETQRLLKETEQRNAELAIINSVQEGLASKLDMQVIYDLVGDKIQEIFDAQVVTINTLDTRNNLSIMEYGVELGKRLELSPSPFSGLEQSIARTRQTILINQDAERRMAELGAITAPGTAFTKSNVFVPMMVGDDLKGYVSLQNVDRENAFSESDVLLLQTLANSMSVALENARLFDETQRLFKAEQQRSAELQIINSVQEGLARKLDLQEIIDLVGEKIGEIFAADTVSVGMYDPERDWVSNRYYIDRGQRIPFPEGPPIRPSLTAMMVDTHKPLLIGTSEESRKLGAVRIPREGEELDKNEAFLGVPILANNRAIGAVSIQSYKQNAFNQNDLRLLQTLANSMSVALENARLFDETQRLLKETEQRAAELAIINSVQEGLASKLDMQSIYDLVGNKIRDIFDAQTAFIATINHQTKMVHTPYYIEKGERFYLQPRPYPDLVKYLIGTRQPILIKENWHESLKVLGIKSIKLPGEPSKSGVFVPLIAGNEVIGLISLQNVEHTNAFTESDMRLLQTLANSMSVALENARLFDETQRLLKETEQRAQELSVINSVQEGLASKLDMQAIYNLVGDKIRNIFDAQVVAITVFDHEKQTRRMIYAFENGQRISDEELRPFNQLAQHLMTTRRPVIMNENAVEVAQQHGMIIVPGTEAPKSIIIVPFGTAQQINGYFSLQNIDREHAFSESDVRLLQTLAGSMGIALENARLFEAERQRAAELAAISTVSQALVADTELENMIQLIGSQMREIFKADIVYVALLDKQTNLIHFPYQFGEAFVTLNFGEGLTSKIIETGEPLLINKDIGERRAQLGKLLVGKESLSFLGVPIKSGRESIGVLSVQNTTAEGVFNDDDLHLLTTIAANAGAAIHTAQLHAE